jgi:hypothetical protein
MSERDGDSVRGGWVVLIIALLGFVVIAVSFQDALTKRDNWIRDLQRRVAILEQQVKQ